MKEQVFNWENMKDGIDSQVHFLKVRPSLIYQDIQKNINLGFVPNRVYLVGCGDSWSSGMAAFSTFEYLTGIPVTPCRSLMFSRYLVRTAPDNSVVILISNSGEVSRTVEAAIQAKKRGLFTIALTSNKKSKLSSEVDKKVRLKYPPHGYAPATVSYLNSLVCLNILAIHLGVTNQFLRKGKARQLVTEISSYAHGLSETISANEIKLEQLAASINKKQQLIFLGAGPNFGTAVFSATKLLEALCINAIGQDLEEWAHTQLLTATNNTITFVLVAKGASRDRAEEVIHALAELPGKCVVIVDDEEKQTIHSADLVIPIFGAPKEYFSPLLYCIPAQLLSYFTGKFNKTTMLGFDSKQIETLNFQQIHHSQILKDAT